MPSLLYLVHLVTSKTPLLSLNAMLYIIHEIS